MPYVTLAGAKIPVKIFVKDLSEVESSAIDQVRATANLPWVLGMSSMSDIHWGNGAPIGSVIVQRDALSPAVVGVDIGCGMMSYETTIKADELGGSEGLRNLRNKIELSVPVGFHSNKEVTKRVFNSFKNLGELSERGQLFSKKATEQLGTLGGGNHYIEICLDKNETVWVMLHSGSRNIGKELAEYHIHKAQGLMGELAKKYPSITDKPIPKELAALLVGTKEYNDYIEDLMWAQRFALANRQEMMLRVLKDLSNHVFGEERLPSTFTTDMKVACHHNYISQEDTEFGASLVTRKGAVSAKAGELGLIPGSMGAKSYVVRGKGSPDSFQSCSHGAGRKMSRGKAKKAFTLEDLAIQTAGVECRKDAGVLDESPGAYKNIEEVMENQSDLVDVVTELRQVICVKG
jgi:tRNA-splicing ligase RtcB